MTELFPPWPLLSAFVVASLILAVTPGPGVLYIVTRSIVQGRRSGLASVAGVALGNLGNAFAASVGLAALFAVSSLAFSVVKYAGAFYLVYLGVQMLRFAPAEQAAAVPSAVSLWRVFSDGFVVALLNPKTTIFFAAFLPQFLSPGASPVWQGLALGALFVVIAAAVVPEAVVVIEGDVAVRDERVGDFVQVVGEAGADAAGHESRDAQAKTRGFARQDVSAPPRHAGVLRGPRQGPLLRRRRTDARPAARLGARPRRRRHELRLGPAHQLAAFLFTARRRARPSTLHSKVYLTFTS